MPGSTLKFKLGNPIVFTLDTKADLSDATVFQIEYTKPDFTYGLLTATRVTDTTKITAVLPGTSNDQLGEWSARPVITFSFDPAPVDGDEVEFVVRPRRRTAS
jgi:hypothetical protein